MNNTFLGALAIILTTDRQMEETVRAALHSEYIKSEYHHRE